MGTVVLGSENSGGEGGVGRPDNSRGSKDCSTQTCEDLEIEEESIDVERKIQENAFNSFDTTFNTTLDSVDNIFDNRLNPDDSINNEADTVTGKELPYGIDRDDNSVISPEDLGAVVTTMEVLNKSNWGFTNINSYLYLAQHIVNLESIEFNYLSRLQKTPLEIWKSTKDSKLFDLSVSHIHHALKRSNGLSFILSLIINSSYNTSYPDIKELFNNEISSSELLLKLNEVQKGKIRYFSTYSGGVLGKGIDVKVEESRLYFLKTSLSFQASVNKSIIKSFDKPVLKPIVEIQKNVFVHKLFTISKVCNALRKFKK